MQARGSNEYVLELIMRVYAFISSYIMKRLFFSPQKTLDIPQQHEPTFVITANAV